MTSVPATSTATCWAYTPFYSLDDADFIVRSSNGMCFPIQKCFLVHASTFYRNLLADSTPTETLSGLPVYDVPENRRITRIILNLCSPVRFTSGTILFDNYLFDSVQALRKYMMDRPEARLVSWLEYSLPDVVTLLKPMKLFVISRFYGWKVLAALAAKRTLQFPLTGQEKGIKELDQISASDYLRLKEYHALSKKAAVRAMTFVKAGTPEFPVVIQGLTLISLTTVGKHVTAILSKLQLCKYCACLSNLHVFYSSENRTKVAGWAHSWVVDFVRDVRAKLEEAPGVGVLREDADKAMHVAAKACPSQTPEGVRALIDTIERHISLALSQVHLEDD